MSIINLQLPLSSLARVVSALERIATAAEAITAHLCVPVPDPVYDQSKRYTSTPNFQLIADVESLNRERVRRGEPLFTFEQAAAHLRSELD